MTVMFTVGMLERLSSYPSFLHELEKAIGDSTSILDVGCGSNSPLQYIRYKPYSVGIDAFVPSLKRSKHKGIHTDYLNITFSELDCLSSGSFDCVMALDVIEHLNREEGICLLEKIERLSKKKVVIFTPNGFVPQEAYDNNVWLEHKSGWQPSDFINRGYKVSGISGLKFLRGEKAYVKYRPKFFWGSISTLSQYFVLKNPGAAFALLSVKTKKS